MHAKVGGTIVEIGSDDTEYHWRTSLTYDPYDSVGMDFHITQPGVPRGPGTLVKVRFTSLGEGQTGVVLTQSNWEALGEHAETTARWVRRRAGHHPRTGVQGRMWRLI